MAEQTTIEELLAVINDLKSRVLELEKNVWRMSTGSEMPENPQP